MVRRSRINATRWALAAAIVLFVLRPVSAGPLTTALPHVKGTRAIVLGMRIVIGWWRGCHCH